MNSVETTTCATVLVNGQPHPLSGHTSLAALLTALGHGERRGMAVAVNDVVVPRSNWPEHALAAGDRLLVIQATQGG